MQTHGPVKRTFYFQSKNPAFLKRFLLVTGNCGFVILFFLLASGKPHAPASDKPHSSGSGAPHPSSVFNLRQCTTIDTSYLSGIKTELKKEWPHNRTINIVFHGHSVPAGYAKTPLVKTFDSYPYLFLEKLKAAYPYAVVNIIVTAIGGENSEGGAARFEKDVLIHKPDVLLIDYALNDIGIGLDRSYQAWSAMIREAKKQRIPTLLLTPSPDMRIDLGDGHNDLKLHTEQIARLASENGIGLVNSFGIFDSLFRKGDSIVNYMSQVNHPNKSGNDLIADEIMKWFR